MNASLLWLALTIGASVGGDARTGRPSHVLTEPASVPAFLSAWRPDVAGSEIAAIAASTARDVARAARPSGPVDEAFSVAAVQLDEARLVTTYGPSNPSFFQSAGSLPAPVDSRVVAPFGPRTRAGSSTENRHTGLSYDGDDAPSVYAVFRGLVVFAGPIEGLGRVVVIDHGEDYHTVYGLLLDVVVASGDVVGAGTSLGTGGVISAAGEPEFYFEVRDRGVPVDPDDWID